MTKACGKKERVNESLPERSEQSLAGRLVLDFNYDEYAHFLASYDLTEEQKRAHLEALWQLLIAFVELGFGVHPAQQACGNRAKDADETTLAALFRVECKDNHNDEEFADAPMSAAAGESE